MSLAALVLGLFTPGIAETNNTTQVSQRMRLAVLGDSDNHSYGDLIWFPRDSGLRGGRYREQTFQWTEILDRLRNAEFDQGQWDTWGDSELVSIAKRLFGFSSRIPRKQDYEYNFSWSGAVCENLYKGASGQVPQLLNLIERDPELWQSGIVLIRIGINELGTREFLDRAASTGYAGEVADSVRSCLDWIEKAVESIRDRHPDLKIELFGLLNNTDWPPYFDFWRSPLAQQNIKAALDGYDDRLRALAAKDDKTAFFDDNAWFVRYWGGRDADGKPDYRSLEISENYSISNTQGDSPEHAIIGDGHSGTMANAVWVRDLVDFLNRQWSLNLPSIATNELIDIAEGLSQ